ncbi:hypothetical protein BLNAU_13683 [Blattamonas nauphoetae]|uniref:Uncharacterized protein n=1 Tax=Blattamonas nauphoetae TaxID=2049346 RepID=A0ABQ9XG07_9EUKA|nr:hypothetical protein BLNAU_13683 [Blattamonas nauphoetae]
MMTKLCTKISFTGSGDPTSRSNLPQSSLQPLQTLKTQDSSFRLGHCRDSLIPSLPRNPPEIHSFSEANSALKQLDSASSPHKEPRCIFDINKINPSPLLNRVTSFLIYHPAPANRTEDELDHEMAIRVVPKLATLVKKGTYSVHYDFLSFILVLFQRLSLIEQSYLMWICSLSPLLSPLVNPCNIDERTGNSPSASEWMTLAMTDVSLSSLSYISSLIKNMSSFTHSNFVANYNSLVYSLIVLSSFQPACRRQSEPPRLDHWQVEHRVSEKNTNKPTTPCPRPYRSQLNNRRMWNHDRSRMHCRQHQPNYSRQSTRKLTHNHRVDGSGCK